MKGTTGQKQRTKQTKNKTPALALENHGPDDTFSRLVFFLSES